MSETQFRDPQASAAESAKLRGMLGGVDVGVSGSRRPQLTSGGVVVGTLLFTPVVRKLKKNWGSSMWAWQASACMVPCTTLNRGQTVWTEFKHSSLTTFHHD